jgi:hypothetical protein
MQNVRETNRFIWLTSMLARRKSQIASLISRLTALEFPGRMKPKLSEKFHELLRQIEIERDKEFELIAEIQDVEEKHRECRAEKRLEKADRGYYCAAGDDESFFENIKPRKAFGWLFHLLPKFSGSDISDKKQNLNLD